MKVQLDRLKIITRAEYLISIRGNLINDINKKDALIVKNPYNLFICFNNRNEAIIEFTGKILLDAYHELISIDTIYQCFKNICELENCNLEIEKIINNSWVLICDVTKDIELPELSYDMKYLLYTTIKDFHKFQVVKYEKSGYTITNTLKTKNKRLRLSIYNKNKEMQTAKNKRFLNKVKDKNALMESFSNKYRLEANIKTSKQIKQYFKISNTSLLEVLNSNANPLLNIYDAIFEIDYLTKSENISLININKIDELRVAAICNQFGNDIKLIREVLTKCYAKGTNFRNQLSLYKAYINKSHKKKDDLETIQLIRNKISA